MIRIVLADDHAVVRDGVRSMLTSVDDFEVVGDTDNGVEVVELVAALDPDVVLLDLRMPGGDGVEAIRSIRARGLRAGILVLTTYDTDTDTVTAIEAGATGYLLKDAPSAELFDAVRATAAGRTVLSPAVAARLVSHVHAPGRNTALSAREREVITLVAGGASNRTIARELFISEATVKTHLVHAYEKLGVTDRAAAVSVAHQRGILR